MRCSLFYYTNPETLFAKPEKRTDHRSCSKAVKIKVKIILKEGSVALNTETKCRFADDDSLSMSGTICNWIHCMRDELFSI